MKHEYRQVPPLPPEALHQLDLEITQALRSVVTDGESFVVNPTVWYVRDGSRAKACVMNAANYISGTFQHTLKNRFQWETDKTIKGQEIDAFKVFRLDTTGRELSQEKFFELMRHLWPATETATSQAPPFLEAYHQYVKRALFQLPSWGKARAELFSTAKAPGNLELRVGLEFETGNIASSFRALTKLNLLFDLGEIDAGVFITSRSKQDGAARIWPPSNRNGSFEELEKRYYSRIVHFPIWELAFAPDGYSEDAQYLGRRDKEAVRRGNWRYVTKNTGELLKVGRAGTFEVHERPRNRAGTQTSTVLKPASGEVAAKLLEQQMELAQKEEEETPE